MTNIQLATKYRNTIILIIILILVVYAIVSFIVFGNILFNEFEEQQISFSKRSAQSFSFRIKLIDKRVNNFIQNNMDILADNTSAYPYEINSAAQKLFCNEIKNFIICSKNSIEYYASSALYHYFTQMKSEEFFEYLSKNDKRIISDVGQDEKQLSFYVKKIPYCVNAFILCQIDDISEFLNFDNYINHSIFFENSFVSLSQMPADKYPGIVDADASTVKYLKDNWNTTFTISDHSAIHSNIWIEQYNASILIQTKYSFLIKELLRIYSISLCILLTFLLVVIFLTNRYTNTLKLSLKDLSSQINYYIKEQ